MFIVFIATFVFYGIYIAYCTTHDAPLPSILFTILNDYLFIFNKELI